MGHINYEKIYLLSELLVENFELYETNRIGNFTFEHR